MQVVARVVFYTVGKIDTHINCRVISYDLFPYKRVLHAEDLSLTTHASPKIPLAHKPHCDTARQGVPTLTRSQKQYLFLLEPGVNISDCQRHGITLEIKFASRIIFDVAQSDLVGSDLMVGGSKKRHHRNFESLTDDCDTSYQLPIRLPTG